jgi:hypothetical protein
MRYGRNVKGWASIHTQKNRAGNTTARLPFTKLPPDQRLAVPA